MPAKITEILLTAPLKAVQANGAAGQSEWGLYHLDGVKEVCS